MPAVDVARVPLAAADLLEAMPWPVGLLDGRGRLLATNAAWAAASVAGGLIAPDDKRGSDYLQGLDTGRGFSYESGRELAAAIRSVLDKGLPQATVRYTLGEDVWEASAHAGDGSGCEAIVVHVDRTAEETSEEWREACEEATMQLEAARAWKEAHLRSLRQALQAAQAPVTPIRARLFRLLRGDHGELTDAQRASLVAVRDGVEAWWSAEAAIELDAASPPRALGESIQDAVHACQEEALQAGIRLDARIDPNDAPCHEPLRLAALMLLGHAIRSSPAGSTVTVRLRSDDRGALLEIRDDDPVGQDAVTWAGLRFAAAAARSQGGHLVAAGRDDSTGMCVRITLPSGSPREKKGSATGMAVQ